MAARRPVAIPKRGYTVEQAAHYLGVGKSEVYGAIERGELRHRRTAKEFDPERFTRGRRGKGRILIDVRDLDAFFERFPVYGGEAKSSRAVGQ
ncbi:helix-turn-helix domain-containing protein [bacterium]|nr:helix-turn-helix domain-containing protein [bacterium]